MFQSALKNLTNKKGNITLTVVILLAAILITIGTGLVLMTVNTLSIAKSNSSYSIAKTRAESCIEESLSKIKNDNTFQNTVNLNFSDGSQCTSAVTNLPPGDTSNKAKSLKVAALYNGYNYEVTRTVSVLGANNVISAITWQQSDPSTDAVDDKNSALNLAYASNNLSKGLVDSSGNFTTLLTYNGTSSSASVLDYKVSATNMSSLIVSADMVNTLDTQTRVASIQYSTDNGNTFNSINGSTCTTGGSTTTNSTCSFASTSSNPTNVAGTITFSNSFGGNVIVRFNLSGAGGGSEQVGIKTISFSPTSNTFDFIPRFGNLSVEGLTPVQTASVSTVNPTPYDIKVDGPYAYVTTAAAPGNISYLEVFDISKDTPVMIGSLGLNTQGLYGLTIQGKYAYIAGVDNIVYVVDISNPTSPSKIGASAAMASTGTANDIVANGRYVYVGFNSSSSGIQVVDVSNPTAPLLVTVVRTPSSNLISGMKISGKYLYTAFGGPLMGIYDLTTDPSNPGLVSTVATTTNAIGIAVDDKYAYISTNTDGVQAGYLNIIDISNPTSPSLVSTTIVDRNATNVLIQGKYAYLISSYSSVLRVVDISNKSVPITVGTPLSVSGNPYGAFLKGKNIYTLGYNTNLLQVYDIGGAFIQQIDAGGIKANTINLNGSLSAVDGNFKGDVNVSKNINIAEQANFNGLTTVRGNSDYFENVQRYNCSFYVDYTSYAKDTTTGNTIPFSTTCENIYFGISSLFNKISIQLETKAAGLTNVYEYYNGTAWTAFSGLTDNTANFTKDGTITFTVPTNWAKYTIVNGGSQSKYWFRVRSTTAATTGASISYAFPVSTDLFKVYGQSTDATPALNITSFGSVGIGTTAPIYPFEVDGVGTPSGAIGNTGLAFGQTSAALATGYNWIQSYGTKPLSLNPVGNNVGIGTGSPGTKFSIAPATSYGTPSPGTASGAFSILGDTGGYGLYSGVFNSGTVWLQAMRNDTTATSYPIVFNPAGGKVGIGTSTAVGNVPSTLSVSSVNNGSGLAGTAASGSFSVRASDLANTVGAEANIASFGTASGNWESLGISIYRNTADGAWTGTAGCLNYNVDNTIRVNGGNLCINSSGYVGLGGITNPTFRIQLPNTASAAGQGQANAWVTYSSQQWKENITEVTGALDLIARMRGVYFNWKPEEGGSKDVGFIAEEVSKVIPELAVYDSKGNPTGLKYDHITAVLLEGIKEQQAQINALSVAVGNSTAGLSYLTLDNNTLNTKYNISTTAGITAKSLNVDGALTALSIKTDKLSINQNPIGIDPTSGSGVIKQNTSFIVINNKNITLNSKIYLTPKSATTLPLAVTDLVIGKSFTVRIAQNATDDIPFDYLIIGE